ncbi:MAG TPA: SPFH domain-containing protein [Gemmataceae bacterium]|jgi:hypothetical protein|nr:SPFH domain-containing protein [Gemmataceae bacterium]
MEQQENAYLNEVMAEQANVEHKLKRQRVAPAAARGKGIGRYLAPGVVELKKGVAAADESGLDFAEGYGGAAQAVDYRVTGFWRWQTVVVPPNVYVVHTRRGHAEPLHVGLGASFRYNPYTDAFLVIPAAVQTLLINARCVCAERQGILVQAYVQWVVEDVRTAYRRLDFSDAGDPMRIVNLQLREQAEAAIKDKVATMSIDAVLSDKQPIIEELTHRLRAVAEGSHEGTTTSGLGLKIVTVQIKEAVVSSTRLWENLQKPFRAQRERVARMAELEAQQAVARQELLDRQARETAELEYARRLDELKAEQERAAVAERAATEKARKAAEQELALRQFELENQRRAAELATVQGQVELDRARAEQERLRSGAAVELENFVHQAQAARSERDVELAKARRAVENDLSEPHVRAQLIARLPEVAAALPKPEELRTVSITSDQGSGGNALVGFLAGVLGLAEGAWKHKVSANGNGPA